MEYFELNNGVKVPSICFGPGIVNRGAKFSNTLLGKIKNKLEYKRKEYVYYQAISSAISNGFRFIDYSTSYGREDLISKAIKASGIKREEFILTTRISNQDQKENKVKESFYRSLDKYKIDYIDLLMFHWPVPEYYINTWTKILELQQEGLCKIVGVANCHEHHLTQIESSTGILPSINQIEVHPLFTQKELLTFCKKKNICIEAYTPLARFDERMTRLPLLKNLSNKYHKTIAQLILRWHIQNGVIPVFRSLNKRRQIENINIFDFTISNEDLKLIDSININSRLRYDPDNCDFSIL